MQQQNTIGPSFSPPPSSPLVLPPPITASPTSPAALALPESHLNPRYTFDRFVVSGNNAMAFEAACAVAEKPADLYNPLFLHGGVGMGKTHLLQAIGHACRQRGLKMVYIPSEVFTTDLVLAIRQRTTAMFRYRQADVLIVDDIQFMGNKEASQEEFFHTFNALITFDKQIVLASDRHPSALNGLEDRLRSRFSGGLVIDIQPLDLETRMAIVSMWAREENVTLPPDALDIIAKAAPDNARELEGLFRTMVAKTRSQYNTSNHTRMLPTLEGMMHATAPVVVSPEATRQALQDFHSTRRHQVTVGQLICATAQIFGVQAEDLTSSKRMAKINQARQVAMYLAREMLAMSLSQIGEALGGRNHSTVLHGYQKVADDLSQDASLREAVDRIQSRLKQL
jgi:chromosomal replication initiator protein